MEKPSNLTQEERDVWTDAYKFHATFAKMGNTPEEWNVCAGALSQLALKNNMHTLAEKLFMAVYEYLNDERKKDAYQEAAGDVMQSD